MSTAEGKESFEPQRWCFGCLSEIDEMTGEAMKQFSDYPEGLPSWERDDDEEPTPEQPPEENTGE